MTNEGVTWKKYECMLKAGTTVSYVSPLNRQMSELEIIGCYPTYISVKRVGIVREHPLYLSLVKFQRIKI